MSSVDLAAAQQRVLARREAKSREEATRLHVQRSTNATTALSRLPFPVGSLNRRLLDVWDTFRGRTGTNPIFRVGQVDAELLDEELLELLSGQVGDSLKYFRVSDERSVKKHTAENRKPHIKDDWSQEVTLVLRAVLFKLSIWDHNSSYGATLQDLRYIDARRSDIVGIPPSRSQKVLYGVVTVFGRYGWNKWEEWLIGHEEVCGIPFERQFLAKSAISLLRGTDFFPNSPLMHRISIPSPRSSHFSSSLSTDATAL